MRLEPTLLWDLWNKGGPFLGETRPTGRVTIEHNWFLTAATSGVGNYPQTKRPIRWFQRCDDSQVELELPTVKSIDTDRSIDADAGTCTIVIYNQEMKSNLGPQVDLTMLGSPGYYTTLRGKSPEAVARWKTVANSWSNIITPNALLRTYQGYGGSEGTITAAVGAGYLVRTGVWFVDRVKIGTDGLITLECRDAAKLLIEQQLYPPLVPTSNYPLRYCRFEWNNEAAKNSVLQVGSTAVVDRPITVADSAVDRWYPAASPGSALPTGGYLLHGHKASDSLDNNPDSFALSVGNSGPDKPFATDWWEYNVNGQCDRVFLQPWGGNYTMYVSVMENGQWVNEAGIVPYDPSSLYGTQSYVVDTGANIPFVAQYGIPWEAGAEYRLPRIYNAQRIRLSFRNHTKSQWGPWYYRCGIREVKVRTGSGGTPPSFMVGMAEHPSGLGYWLVASDGGIFTYGAPGAVPFLGSLGSTPLPSPICGMARTPGNGYWLVSEAGEVYVFGDAVHHGDAVGLNLTAPIVGMVSTPSGDGYWLAGADGMIHAFGAAVDYGDLGGVTLQAPIVGIAVTTTGLGYWMVGADGGVFAYGDAVNYGNLVGTPLNKPIVGMARTASGDGYWLVAADGGVFTKGGAGFYSAATNLPLQGAMVGMTGTPTAGGYWLVAADGGVFAYGNAGFYGSGAAKPAGLAQADGNYRDYADIVKDLLLWSGFWCKETLPGASSPVIHGNIESTGIYAEECLPDDLFDKRPVIDPITELKETVGYVTFVDDDGGFHFESPNWWQLGNFSEDGQHTQFIPEIDEAIQLTDYTMVMSDEMLRSEIIIAEERNRSGPSGTVTRYTPPTKSILRGMVKPAMWTNGYFTKVDEQRIMAELIGLHIYFRLRQGSVTAWANPCIQINDQVRINERITAETFVHYVRGITTSMDCDSGEYTMSLTTHWLGDDDDIAVET